MIGKRVGRPIDLLVSAEGWQVRYRGCRRSHSVKPEHNDVSRGGLYQPGPLVRPRNYDSVGSQFFYVFGVIMESPLRWQDSYEQLRSAPDERQLFDRIARLAKQLGFEYCCYGIRVPLPVSNPSVAIFDTYPTGWMKHYQESRFIDVDPTVREGMTSSQLIVWPEAKTNAPRLWSEAHDFGLKVGVAHSSWAAHGVYGLLTMARHADALTTNETGDLTLQASWLANLSHSLMSEFVVPKMAPEANVVLTPRECEVLCWTGEGRTAFEIGEILNISERTVNFHVNNLLLKLDATNKVQAVVKAIAMGLISSF